VTDPSFEDFMRESMADLRARVERIDVAVRGDGKGQAGLVARMDRQEAIEGVRRRRNGYLVSLLVANFGLLVTGFFKVFPYLPPSPPAASPHGHP
jgi:hypothetical protein